MREKRVKEEVELRICMLGQKNVPSKAGGVEVVAEELSTRMVKRGCSVTCLNRKGNQMVDFDGKKPHVYKGVRLQEVFTIKRKGLAAVTSSVSGSFAAAFGKYDVVHIHAEGPAFMCWLPKLFGKKIIVTIHGLDHRRAKWGRLASTYIRMGEKNAVRYADEIIVLSESVHTYFQNTYGRDTRFIPNGANQPEIRSADLIKKKFGLEKNSYILFLGRIVPEKGLRYLIEAFKQVNTDKKLVIAGGSSDTQLYMKELTGLASVDDRILFTGFVQGRLREELYSNAYVYTLPSDLEGMPLSLLEAMSYGNCCVVSDIPECSEVVEDKAVLFKKGDTKDLNIKLQSLCDDINMADRYRNLAAEFVCNKYNWDDVVDKTLELYR